jgi:hypothetical protein
MAARYAQACVAQCMGPTPDDDVVVKLDETEYRVPASEAKPKEGADFQKCALGLARDALYRAAHVQHAAARERDGVAPVLRLGLVISAHAPGNEYLLADDPMPLVVPSAAPAPLVVNENTADAAAASPPSKCVTCSFDFSSNGHSHEVDCEFAFLMNSTDSVLIADLRALRIALRTGYAGHYRRTRPGSARFSRQQWTTSRWDTFVAAKHHKVLSKCWCGGACEVQAAELEKSTMLGWGIGVLGVRWYPSCAVLS